MSGGLALLANLQGPTDAGWWIWLAAPAFYLLFMFLFSRLGGWGNLARRYPGSPGRPPGLTYRSRSLQLRGAFGPTYGRGVHVTLTPRGLYLRAKFGHRLFHPPILLPWWSVRSVQEQHLAFLRWLEVHCATEGPACRISLPLAAASVVNAEIKASRRGVR